MVTLISLAWKALGFVSSPFKWVWLVLGSILGENPLKRIVVLSGGILVILGMLYGVFMYRSTLDDLRNTQERYRTAQDSILALKDTLGKVMVSLEEEKARNRILVDSMSTSIEQTVVQSRVRNEKLSRVRQAVQGEASAGGSPTGSFSLDRLQLIREAGNKYIRGE